ncbi:MAG: hypothetical protein U1F87_09020 [Kiritimatiellia bacterium]
MIYRRADFHQLRLRQTALSDEESCSSALLHPLSCRRAAGRSPCSSSPSTAPKPAARRRVVAVNPRDERYKDLPGKTVLLGCWTSTVRQRSSRTITWTRPRHGGDDLAHDPNDYEMGQRHGWR